MEVKKKAESGPRSSQSSAVLLARAACTWGQCSRCDSEARRLTLLREGGVEKRKRGVSQSPGVPAWLNSAAIMMILGLDEENSQAEELHQPHQV